MIEDQGIKKAKKASKVKMILGSSILIIGFLSPLLIPVVSGSSLSASIKTILSGLLALGIPELFILIAIGIMGKEGYETIKQSFFGFLKRNGPPRTVSITRYRIGLFFFTFVLLIGLAMPYVLSFYSNLMEHLLMITLVSDLFLISCLWILGGDFWDKLRSLYIYNSRAILLSKNK